MIALVIFDCDGVLFDSASANVAYYNAVLERLGRPPLDEEWGRRAHFLSSHQLFQAMFGADSELGATALQAGRDVDYGPFYELMLPAPGLEDVLRELQQRYRLAMATNRGGTLRGVMERFGLGRFLELAVGAHDVQRPKPHPDMLEKCLVHFGVDPAQSVYIGDSETDHEAAVAAGVHFVAVGDLTPAARRIGDLRELPALLQQPFG